MERHKQVPIIYRNIHACVYGVVCGMEAKQSKCEMPWVVENGRTNILWDFQMQNDKQVKANQLDIGVFDKQEKKAMVTDVAYPSDCNIRKKDHEKLEKY